VVDASFRFLTTRINNVLIIISDYKMNYLIRKNLQLVNNPGLGFCGIFATELILALCDINQRLQNHRDDAKNEGKSSYKTRLSLRGNPGNHCEKMCRSYALVDN